VRGRRSAAPQPAHEFTTQPRALYDIFAPAERRALRSDYKRVYSEWALRATGVGFREARAAVVHDNAVVGFVNRVSRPPARVSLPLDAP